MWCSRHVLLVTHGLSSGVVVVLVHALMAQSCILCLLSDSDDSWVSLHHISNVWTLPCQLAANDLLIDYRWCAPLSTLKTRGGVVIADGGH
jgi:hypothetical protein